MKFFKLRELKEAVTAVVKGPYTHEFPAEPTPLPEWIRGKPEYHSEDCIGCGACAEVCPARAIEITDLERWVLLSAKVDRGNRNKSDQYGRETAHRSLPLSLFLS